MFLWLSLTLIASKVPQPLVEVELTFGQTVTVNATCLFMHPHHNMAPWLTDLFRAPTKSTILNFLRVLNFCLYPRAGRLELLRRLKKGWTRQCLLLIVDVSSLFGPFDWTRCIFWHPHFAKIRTAAHGRADDTGSRWIMLGQFSLQVEFMGNWRVTGDLAFYTIWPGKFIMESLILWWYDGICPGKFPNFLENFLTGWWFGTWTLFFHLLGIIIPTDSYFSEGWRKTTNQWVILNIPSGYWP